MLLSGLEHVHAAGIVAIAVCAGHRRRVRDGHEKPNLPWATTGGVTRLIGVTAMVPLARSGKEVVPTARSANTQGDAALTHMAPPITSRGSEGLERPSGGPGRLIVYRRPVGDKSRLERHDRPKLGPGALA
jgi:hypothetical protein